MNFQSIHKVSCAGLGYRLSQRSSKQGECGADCRCTANNANRAKRINVDVFYGLLKTVGQVSLLGESEVVGIKSISMNEGERIP